MIDRGMMTEVSEPLAGDGHVVPPVSPNPSLEQRVRRLEDAVALLQDTRQVEERVLQRVATRVGTKADGTFRESAKVLVSAGRQLLPAALDMLQPTGTPDVQASVSTRDRRRWLVLDLYAEAQAVVRMFVDARYRPYLTWTARIVPLAVFAFILGSQWVMPWNLIPLVGPLIDKTVCLILAFVGFRVLSRESRRYREMLPNLSGRPLSME
jgi:hypothetical protein